jgi:hypothetical protein
MSIFQDYEKKRAKLLEKLETPDSFEKGDKTVGKVYAYAREIYQRSNTNDVNWLLRRGMELSTLAGVLDGKATSAWGEYRTAEMAYKSLRDGLVLAGKSEHDTVTAAKAAAYRSTQDAEVDALRLEQRAKYYASAADMCNRIVMFIQTTVRWRESEMIQTRVQERGQA